MCNQKFKLEIIPITSNLKLFVFDYHVNFHVYFETFKNSKNGLICIDLINTKMIILIRFTEKINFENKLKINFLNILRIKITVINKKFKHFFF